MEINIQSLHFNSTEELRAFVTAKLHKLENLYSKIVSAEVYLKLEPESAENKVCEIKLDVPGEDIFAKKQAKSFEEATDLACDALAQQIKTLKAKTESHR